MHVSPPTHLRTPSPAPPSPCVDVLGVVVGVWLTEMCYVAAARMSGRSRRTRRCAVDAIVSARIASFDTVPSRATSFASWSAASFCLGCVRARAPRTWLSVTYFGPPRWRTSSLTRSRSRLTSSVFFFGTSHLPLVCPRAYLLSAQISTGTFARKTAARTLHTATAPGARGSHHITHIQGNFTSYTFRDQPPQQPNEHDAYIYGIRVRRPSPVAPTHSPAMLGLTSLLADPYMYRPAALGGSASRSTKSMKLDRSARPSN